MVNILAFPGAWNAARTGSQAPVGPDRSAPALLTATPDGTIVIAATSRADAATASQAFAHGDWSNQELADLYRVEALLVQANIRISTGRGLTDEGDPWFVFCKEDGDVFVHLARIDGAYLLDSPGLGEILHGSTFSILIDRFIQIAAAKATPASNIVTLRPRLSRDSVVRLHPAVMLAALVWSLYLASSKFGGVAHAAEDLDGQAHHGGHPASSPADVDGALAHLVEHLPKVDVAPAAPATPVERVAGPALLDTADKSGFDLRVTGGFSSQGVGASLTVIAFSYGLYISADQQQPERDIAGKSVALSAPAEEQHATPAPEAPAAMVLLKPAPEHETKPDVAKDGTAAEDATSKALQPPPALNGTHDVKPATDFSHTFAATDATSHATQAVVPDFLSQREDNNITLQTLLETPAKASVASAPAETAPVSDTQSVLGLISHYIGPGEVYKVGGLIVSATFDIDDLDKVLSHLGDTSVAPATEGTAVAIDKPAEVQPGTATAAIGVTQGASLPVAAPNFSHYDDHAKQFVTHFIQESDSIQMVQINASIVLVDMSAITDPGDQIYTRSWSTDDGHVISTIGHLQDFVSQGMV